MEPQKQMLNLQFKVINLLLIIFIDPPLPTFEKLNKVGTTVFSFTWETAPTFCDKIYYTKTDGTKAILGDCVKENADKTIKCTTTTDLAAGDYALYLFQTAESLVVAQLKDKLSIKAQAVSEVSPAKIKANKDESLIFTFLFNTNGGEEAKMYYKLDTSDAVKFKSCTKETTKVTCVENITTTGTYKILFDNVDTTKTFEVSRGKYLVLALSLFISFFLF